jgi:hypothetical protein
LDDAAVFCEQILGFVVFEGLKLAVDIIEQEEAASKK